MSVETVLEKLTEHNSDVIGCIARSGSKTWSNLRGPYDVVDCTAVSEHASNMLSVTDGLETDHPAFDQLFLEYESHSFYARRLDDGVLVLLTRPIRRTHFKKMQVGVNLFIKPLRRAIEDGEPTQIEPVTADEEPSAQRRRFYRGIRF